MPVLIDGYNLLHAARESKRASLDIGRFQLSRMLGDWSAIRNETVTVVLDGAAPPAGLASQLSDPRIVTVYAGRMTADERIAELLAADSAARRICVVSSDREVQMAARRHRATSVKSEAFFEAVCRELKQQTVHGGAADPEEKDEGLKPSAAREWLESFGFDPDEPASFEHP
jgi:predicted RNA-binding protein with PIN domain